MKPRRYKRSPYRQSRIDRKVRDAGFWITWLLVVLGILAIAFGCRPITRGPIRFDNGAAPSIARMP